MSGTDIPLADTVDSNLSTQHESRKGRAHVDIFVSFPWEKRAFALSLVQRIEREQPLACFYCDRDLGKEDRSTNELLRKALADALARSTMLLVIWDQSARSADWCQWEISEFRTISPDKLIAYYPIDTAIVPIDRGGPGDLTEVSYNNLPSHLKERVRTPRPLLNAAHQPRDNNPVPRSGLLQPLPLLLGRPYQWALRSGFYDGNVSWIDVFGSAQQRQDARHAVRFVVTTYVAAALACLLLLGAAYVLTQLLGAGPKTFRHQSMSFIIALVIGTFITIAHGIGAGSAGMVWGAAAGFSASILATLLDYHRGGIVGATTAGALIGAVTAYRRHLSPFEGRALRSVPLAGVAGLILAIGCGLGIGWAAVRLGFNLPEAVNEFVLTHPELIAQPGALLLPDKEWGWNDISRDWRMDTGMVLGSVASFGFSLAALRRGGFQVRARRAWLGVIYLVPAAGMVALCSGFVACLDTRGVEDPLDGIVIGWIIAVAVVSVYLLPASLLSWRMRDSTHSLISAACLVGIVAFLRGQLEDNFANIRAQVDVIIHGAILGIIVALSWLWGAFARDVREQRLAMCWAASLLIHAAALAALTVEIKPPIDPDPVQPKSPPPDRGGIQVDFESMPGESTPLKDEEVADADARTSGETWEAKYSRLKDDKATGYDTFYKELRELSAEERSRFWREWCSEPANARGCRQVAERKQKANEQGAQAVQNAQVAKNDAASSAADARLLAEEAMKKAQEAMNTAASVSAASPHADMAVQAAVKAMAGAEATEATATEAGIAADEAQRARDRAKGTTAARAEQAATEAAESEQKARELASQAAGKLSEVQQAVSEVEAHVLAVQRIGARAAWQSDNDVAPGIGIAVILGPNGHFEVRVAPGYRVTFDADFSKGDLWVAVSIHGGAMGHCDLSKGGNTHCASDASEISTVYRVSGPNLSCGDDSRRLQGSGNLRSLGFEDQTHQDCNEPILKVQVVDTWNL